MIRLQSSLARQVRAGRHGEGRGVCGGGRGGGQWRRPGPGTHQPPEGSPHQAAQERHRLRTGANPEGPVRVKYGGDPGIKHRRS